MNPRRTIGEIIIAEEVIKNCGYILISSYFHFTFIIISFLFLIFLYLYKALVCVTMATVNTIEDPYRWCYLSCSACNKIVQPYPMQKGDDGPALYSCETCDADVTDVTPR